MTVHRLPNMGIAAFAIAAVALLAPVQAWAQATPPAQITLAGGYILGPSDVIEVSVAGRDDYKARVEVQPDGMVTLPLIGPVTASNKTLAQLREDIRNRLVTGGFYTAPEVVASLASQSRYTVTVLGEVVTPGVVPVDRVFTLSEIIARAGGLRGQGTDVITLTPVGGAASQYSLRAISTGATADPTVNPGDRVFVAPPEMFYIYGQVGAPGTYPIDAGMTVRQALARGGGLTQLGSERRIKVVRGDREARVGLDEKLQPGDTVVVGERFF